jgi:phosphate/sulfate permease
MAENLTFILIAILIVMGFSLAFSIGANDETLAPLVGANILRFRVALIIGGIATGVGMVFFSQGVGKTVGADILGPGIQYSVFMLLSVLISSIIWLIIGSFIGIPLSSTHSTVGSIFGVVLIYAIFEGGINPLLAFNYEKLGNVILSWFLSPLFGLLVTYMLFRIAVRLYLSKLKGLNQIENTERKIKWILFISVIFAEIWVGANSAECIGIFYGLFYSGSISNIQYYLFVIICGIMVFLGIFIAGRYVIKNLASQMTGSRPSEGLILQTSSSVILMIATLLSLPISHSHVVVFCIIGLNLAQKKEISKKSIGKVKNQYKPIFPILFLLISFF